MHPCIPRLERPWLSAAVLRLALCCAGLALPVAVDAATTIMSFENGYISGQSAVGVDDPDLSGTAAWQAWPGSDPAVWVASAGSGANGTRSLRIADDSTAAYTYYLNIGAAAGMTYDTQPYTISFDLRLSKVNAADSLRRARVELGRLTTAPDTADLARGWFIFEVVGNEMRLLVLKHDGSAQQAVKIGEIAAGTFVHVAITVDPVAKQYANVVVKGAGDAVDVTSAVQAVGGLPWKRVSTDGTLPNRLLWVSSGAQSTATIDLDNVRISHEAETWIATSATSAGVQAEWLPYLKTDTSLKVEHDTALDFGTKLKLNRHADGDGHAKITARGFAQVDQDGDLSFTNGEKVRLFCASEVMLHFPVPDNAPDSALQYYVNQIARAGYNAYRPHFLDVYLMQGSTENAVFNPTRFTRWKRLAKMLREKGIYLIMDASTSWNSFCKEPMPGHDCGQSTEQCASIHGYPFQRDGAKRQRINVRMFWGDAVARAQWRAGVKLLYETLNSEHTGPEIALKDDPQVVLTNLRNESGFFFRLMSDKIEGPLLSGEPGLLACWREWLADTYGTTTALNGAWPSPDYSSFGDVPLPLASTDSWDTKMNADGPRITDLRRFEVDKDQELFVWMQQTLRDIGVKSLLVDCNNVIDGPSMRVRDIMPGVDTHSYHDHGAAGEGIAWDHDNSSLGDDALGMARRAGQVRQHGGPLTVTEWGQPFWNAFRHEAGLVFPSYAALGGWSMIAQHAEPIGQISATTGNILVDGARTFQLRYDPTAKAAEYISALLYGRGDVAASAKRIQLKVDPFAIINPANPNKTVDNDTWGLAYPYNMLPLFARFGTTVKPTPVMTDDFEDEELASVTAVADGSGWNKDVFWSVAGDSGGLADCAGGKLRLRAANQPWARYMARSDASATSTLDLFTHPRTFFIKGPAFESNDLAPHNQVFRFAVANGSAFASDGSASVVLLVFGDNRVRFGYKVGGGAYQYLPDVYAELPRTPGAIRAISFTPVAGYIDAPQGLTGADPVYDLVIHLDGAIAGAVPAYLHRTGRWPRIAGQVGLTDGNWGSSSANTVQLQVQKLDGVSNSKYTLFSCEEFLALPRQVGPRRLDLFAEATFEYPSARTSAGLIDALKTAGVLALGNRTEAPVFSSPSEPKAERYLSGVYESATEQLYHEPAKRLFTVNTDRSEGATLPATLADGSPGETSVTVNHVKITNRNAPYRPASVSVLVSSLEPETSATKNVNDSGRLLLIVASDALNSGQTFQDYRRLAVLKSGAYEQWGSPPVLLRRASVEVRIRRINSTALKVYPLKPDGTRHAKALGGVTTSTDASGTWLVVPIDTGALIGEDGLPGVNGPAMFFEIAPAL